MLMSATMSSHTNGCLLLQSDHALLSSGHAGMGNLVPLAPGEAGPAGLGAVHGVLHRLSAADYGRLCCMEHEYRCAGPGFNTLELLGCCPVLNGGQARCVSQLPGLTSTVLATLLVQLLRARSCTLLPACRPVELAVKPYGSDAAVPAVAFVSPEERLIADGLPPPQR